jgi:predicted nucleic acid-binding protein
MSVSPASLDRIVVDSDVASFVFKRDPIRAPRYRSHLHGRQVVLPFAVVAELLYWSEKNRWGAPRRLRLEAFIQSSVLIYPDYPLCALWADVRWRAQRAGREIDSHDAWNAAVAVFLDVPLLTHNARHYAGVPGLQVITVPDTPP